MKSAYVPERNVLLTANEYKILQQTALEASYLILNSFSSISKKDPSTVCGDQTIIAEANERADLSSTLESIKLSRRVKVEHTRLIEAFNSDPASSMEKMKTEGFIANGPEYTTSNQISRKVERFSRVEY